MMSSGPKVQEKENPLRLTEKENVGPNRPMNQSVKKPGQAFRDRHESMNVPSLEQHAPRRASQVNPAKYKVISKPLTGDVLVKAVEEEELSITQMMVQCRLEPEVKVIPNYEKTRYSTKRNGPIHAYAVNTNKGGRNYNEDRVSIILNINKNDIKSSFFAVYDGHGGSACSDFLRDHLHQLIIDSPFFPEDPRKAIIQGIAAAETEFLAVVKYKFKETNVLDRSGSCANVMLVVDDEVYVANVGDSRSILSIRKGKQAFSMSKDHRPHDRDEQKRIEESGGVVYRTEVHEVGPEGADETKARVLNVGPLRAFPGRLSVTRTIGDIEAKLEEFGGLRNCISCQP